MALTLGSVTEGKITGITKFGAFVSLGDNKSGMVHISEVSRDYVSDINEHLKVGQIVKVKIISISDDGKINLSIKKAEESEQKKPARASAQPLGNGRMIEKSGDSSFEDKLKQFMQDSESRLVDIKHQSDKKSGRSRRR